MYINHKTYRFHQKKAKKRELSMISKRNKKKTSKNKENRKRVQDKNMTADEEIFMLEDQSAAIRSQQLEKAASKLKKKFKELPKSLMRRGLPSPYIRHKESRPLHFTKDGSYLMYFTKTEFIKVEVPSLEIVKRTKLTRADLSPLYYDYKIWSHDNSKVVAFDYRVVDTYLYEDLKTYVYDTLTGEYTEICEKLVSQFSMGREDLKKATIECFNPVDNRELIIGLLPTTETEGPDGLSQYDTYENIYTWNWRTCKKRLISKVSKSNCLTYVATQSEFIITMYNFFCCKIH